jgi:calpain-7
LTIHLLRNNEKRERMWYPHGPRSLVNGAYSNNPHVLVRYDVTKPDDKYISLVLSQHQKHHDLGYTLSCYCTEPFHLAEPRADLPFVMQISGEWTSTTAGGPVGTPDFFSNPLYNVTVPDECEMQIRCSTERCVAANVIMLRQPGNSSGNCPRAAKHYGEPVLDSGNYRHGFAVTERSKVLKGSYAVFVSTFHGNKLGKYHITIAHSTRKGLHVERMQ